MKTQANPVVELKPEDVFNYIDRRVIDSRLTSEREVSLYNHIYQCPVCYSAAWAYAALSFNLNFINNPKIMH